MNGSHRQFGVSIQSGETIEPQEVKANMADIAPTTALSSWRADTILHGRECAEYVLQIARGISTIEYHPISRSDKENSSAEHDAIHRRLEQLGYL